MLSLNTINVKNKKSLGIFQYEIAPHDGEWIEIGVKSKGETIATIFVVKKIIHSSDGHGADLYVEKLASTQECLAFLFA
jgi:hypothetical protein